MTELGNLEFQKRVEAYRSKYETESLEWLDTQVPILKELAIEVAEACKANNIPTDNFIKNNQSVSDQYGWDIVRSLLDCVDIFSHKGVILNTHGELEVYITDRDGNREVLGSLETLELTADKVKFVDDSFDGLAKFVQELDL